MGMVPPTSGSVDRAPNDMQLRRNLARMLEAFGRDQAAAQRAEHLRCRRSPRTFRYQPGAFHREACRLLGSGSSQEVAETIHAPELACYLGFMPKTRLSGPLIVRVIGGSSGTAAAGDALHVQCATTTPQVAAEMVAAYTPHRWEAFAAVAALPDRGGTIHLPDRRIAVETTTHRRLLDDLGVLAIGAPGLSKADWPWASKAVCAAWTARVVAGKPAPMDERRPCEATVPTSEAPDGTLLCDEPGASGWWERRRDRWTPITHARAYDVLNGAASPNEAAPQQNG